MSKVKQIFRNIAANIRASRLVLGDNPVYLVLVALASGFLAHSNRYTSEEAVLIVAITVAITAYLIECVFYIDRKDILGVGTECAFTAIFAIALVSGLIFCTQAAVLIAVVIACGYLFPALVNLVNSPRPRR